MQGFIYCLGIVAGFFVYRHLGLLECNIVLMKRFLPLLILTGLLFGQEIAASQRIDALYQFGKLEDVEKQARVDAKEDLGPNVMLWGVTGLFHIFPVPFAWVLPVKLPENRQKALLSLDEDYQSAYRLSYKKAVKKQRFNSIGKGCCIIYGTFFVLSIQGGSGV